MWTVLQLIFRLTQKILLPVALVMITLSVRLLETVYSEEQGMMSSSVQEPSLVPTNFTEEMVTI